jgi:hypothetical protein
MTESVPRLVTRTVRLLSLACILGVCVTSAVAQHSAQNQKPSTLDEKAAGDESGRAFAPVEEEIRAKRAIQIEEREYQQNLEKARNLSFLGTSLVTAFKEKNTLDREDLKKLEKVEKLAKNIREAAGGSEDNVQMDKPPADLASALAMLGDLSKSLKEKVEKTPKHVISAAVIDEANVLLELIRIVRTLPPKV